MTVVASLSCALGHLGLCWISRSQWQALEPLEPPRPRSSTRRIVVHHSSRPVIRGDDLAAELRQMQRVHLMRGMIDIGYHLLIGPEGQVLEGRAGGLHVRGEHALGFDASSVGVCVIGNFEERADGACNPIDQHSPAFESLRLLCLWLCGEFGLQPHHLSAVRATQALKPGMADAVLPQLVSHRELDVLLEAPAATTCSGDPLKTLLRYLRGGTAHA